MRRTTAASTPSTPRPERHHRKSARRAHLAARRGRWWLGVAVVLLLALGSWAWWVGQAMRSGWGQWVSGPGNWLSRAEPQATGAPAAPPLPLLRATGPANTAAAALGSTAVVSGRPAPLEQDSKVAAQVLPQPIPLARSARDPQGAARQAAIEQDPGSFGVRPDPGGTPDHLRFHDADGRAGSIDIGQAAVSEADLAMPFLPGSQALPQDAVRLRDPASGTQVSVTLRSPMPPAEAAAFYRAQLGRQSRPGEALVQVQQLGAGQTLITRTLLLGGAQQAVLISPDGAGVLVRLVRNLPPGTTAADKR